MNRQCGYEKLLGVVILGVGAGGTPPPEIFLTKNVIFPIISPKFEFIGPEKLLGVDTPTLGAPSPLKKIFGLLDLVELSVFYAYV